MSTVVLRIQYADGRSEDRTLQPGSYDVGRESGHIALGDANVSGLHARIEVRPGQVIVTDLGSTNGTFDGRGQRLTGPYSLTQSETVRFGGSSIQWLPSRPLAGGTQVMAQVEPGFGAAAPALGGAPPPHQLGAQPPHHHLGGAPPHHQLGGAPLPHHHVAHGGGAAPHGSFASHGQGPHGGPAPGAPLHGGFQPPPQQQWSAPQFGQPPPQVPMNLATWGQRVVGYLIDTALVAVVMSILYVVFGGVMTGFASLSSAASPDVGAGIMSGGCCMTVVLVPISTLLVGVYNRVYLVSKRGASIGQGLMKLKVVDAQGNLLSMGQAALRLVVQALLAMLQLGAVIDLLWPLWDDRRQTLHDKAVNSFVIHAP